MCYPLTYIIIQTWSHDMDHRILIVGAGPSGLTAAAFLTHYKIPCRIIDKKLGPPQHQMLLAYKLEH